jgi:hypothetical protein
MPWKLDKDSQTLKSPSFSELIVKDQALTSHDLGPQHSPY